MIQLPKQIRKRLGKNPDSGHPDPNLLTAFMEDTLAAGERDSVLSHLGSCSECRQIVVLAAPPSPIDLGAAQNRTAWSFSPVLRWGTLFATFVIVAAAVLVFRTSHPSPVQTSDVVMLDKTLPAASPAQTDSRSSRLAKHIPGGNTSIETVNRRGLAKTPDRTDALASANSPKSRESAVPAGLGMQAKLKDNSVQRRNETTDTDWEVTSGESGGGDRDKFARNSVAVAKATPPFTPRPTTETAASTIGGPAKLTDFRAPAWRLSKDGFPERSFTPGVWEKLEVDHRGGFHAISANDMEVWVGGPGVLYHSEDMGLNWTRMIPVTGDTMLSGDVIFIAFTDHLHGKFSTASGQTWVTDDAGKSWTIR